jgi:hypothetical protein
MTSMLVTLRAARHFVTVLAFAVAFASTAKCLAAVAADSATPSCHASEPRSERAAVDCCPGESPDSQTLAASPLAVTPAAPLPIIVAVLREPAVPGDARLAGIIDPATGSSKPPGIATYVLVSAFRI